MGIVAWIGRQAMGKILFGPQKGQKIIPTKKKKGTIGVSKS
jgi:hypothetical protein